MKNKKLLTGVLVALTIVGGTTFLAPDRADASNPNWALNQAATQVYLQNMATQQQLMAQQLAASQYRYAAPYGYPVTYSSPRCERHHRHRFWRR